MRDSWKLGLLLVVHVACGLLACGLYGARLPAVAGGFDPPVVLLFAVLLCQAGLLGFWAACSGVAWPRRLAGLVVGTEYLTLLFFARPEELPDFPPIAALSSVTTAGVLLMVRGRIVREAPGPGRGPTPEKRRRTLRFSIRGLMLLTLAVALVAAAFRSIRGALADSSTWVLFSSFTLCAVIVTLAACRATLDRARPLGRSLGVVVLSAVVGALFCQGLPDDGQTFYHVLAILGLEAVLSLASLLVVRSCGYRLVRRPAPGPGMVGRPRPLWLVRVQGLLALRKRHGHGV